MSTSNKRVLALYFSQSGQLGEIVGSLTAPLVRAGVDVETLRIEPEQPYPFPWTGDSFFSVMPDCVLERPVALKLAVPQQMAYDLVILAWQPWFLSPSIPSRSMLEVPELLAVMQASPVITICAGRNMWLNAFSKFREVLRQKGIRLAGNIALVDRHPNLVSFVTIFHWMLGGKKTRFLNVFPTPGVSDKDIAGCSRFGEVILRHLKEGSPDSIQQELMSLHAVEVDKDLMVIESRAGAIFNLWARFIVKRKNPQFWLAVFKYYLLIALLIAAPLVFVINRLLFRPFMSRRLERRKQAYITLN